MDYFFRHKAVGHYTCAKVDPDGDGQPIDTYDILNGKCNCPASYSYKRYAKTSCKHVKMLEQWRTLDKPQLYYFSEATQRFERNHLMEG